MGFYKIKNVTNRLPKRNPNKDRVLKIDYKVGFKNEFYNLKAGEEIAISCTNLPVNIHVLRAKSLITVSQISEGLFHKTKRTTVTATQDTPTVKTETEEIVAVVEEAKEEKKKTTTRRSSKKTRTTTTASPEATEE